MAILRMQMNLRNQVKILLGLLALVITFVNCRTVRFKPVNTLIVGVWERTPIDATGTVERWTFSADGSLIIRKNGVAQIYRDANFVFDTIMSYKVSPAGTKWTLYTDNYFVPNDVNLHWIVVDIDSKGLYLSSIQGDGRRSLEQREFVRVQ